MTFSIEPQKYSAGYSFIPMAASASITSDFEYLIDVVYNKVEVISISQVSLVGLIRVQLELNNNPFKSGERIYFEDTNNGGYYTILFSNLQNIIIDLSGFLPLSANPYVYSYYGYKLPPHPERATAELDLSPVLRNFVSKNIAATNSIYSAEDTRFNYDVILGERKVYEFEFYDNAFNNGNVAFRNDTIPSSQTPPFQIGDQIFIQQEQTTLNYQYFIFGDYLEVGDPGAAAPLFTTEGQTLLLNSQTASQYNGFTTIREVLSQRIVLNIEDPIASVAGEAVEVSGFIKPEYNGVHTITDIFYDTGLNEWFIRTDIPWGGNTPPIPGKITLASGERTTINNLTRINNLDVFNARWDKREYKKSYEEYVIDGICESEKKISTIYTSFPYDHNFRYSERKKYSLIQPDAFSHLLIHNEEEGSTEGIWIETFDRGDNQLSLSFLENNSNNELDYYAPIGLLDIADSSDLINDIGTFSDVLSDIAYYVVWAGPEPCIEPIEGDCCIEKIVVCYPDGFLVVCQNIEMDFGSPINGTNSWSGSTNLSGTDYDVLIYWTGFRWRLTYFPEGTAGTVGTGVITTMANRDGLITDCPIGTGGFAAPGPWDMTTAFYDLYDPTTELGYIDVQGGECESGSEEHCCSTYSRKIPFVVDTCSKYKTWTIFFKDRRGSWAQYPFKLVSRDFIETERNNFYKQEGTFTNSDFFYDDFDRGEKSFATRSRKKSRLTSDWVSDAQNYIIEDLFKSVSVFIQYENEIIPVILENKEYESKIDINEMIHNYQFDVTISNDDWRF